MAGHDHYAVFGYPIKHSLSPQIHSLFAEQTGQQNFHYSAQPVPAEDFSTALTTFFAAGGKGLNCTVPLKELAFRAVTETTERAGKSKAVNTIILQPDGSLLGDNTDGIGLLRDLQDNHGLDIAGKSLLILGAGGATRGIIGPLLAAGASITVANRTEARAHQLAGEFSASGSINGSSLGALAGQSFDLILNATSASLSGDLPPLPRNILSTGGCCYDLAYAAEPTPFVTWGRQIEAHKSLDGLGMLVEQAAEAFYLWRGVRPETRSVIEQMNRQLGPGRE